MPVERTRPPPYYRNGGFATPAGVVDRCDVVHNPGLQPAEKADLAEFLKSL